MPDKNRTASGVLGGLAGLVGLSAVAGVLVAATVTPAVAITGTAAERAITMFDNLPSVLEIDKLMLPSNFYATDPGTGQPVLLTQFLEQDRTPVEFDQISPVMYDALLSSEDPRYYQHGGVDLIGTTRALLSNAQSNANTQGGSTISQQYVKNVLIQKCEQNAETEYETNDAGEVVLDEATGLPVVKVTRDEALRNCWVDATTAEGADGYMRKLQEMRYAISLEQKYSKNDILLGYLNIGNFGGITYGVEAAARRYFSTNAANLTVAQAATLAGMVQNPNRYRIDQPAGSIVDADGATFNKAPDGIIDEGANITVLDELLESGEITPEQHLAAADGYTSTKVRQLYVISRMLEDGKITREQYVEAAAWPITPVLTEPKTGCVNAGGAAYFCQYVKDVILNDPAFGETAEDRADTLRRGGLNVYTTLDPRVQGAAEASMAENVPTSLEGIKLGSTVVSLEATSGRVLAIAQNTTFTEDASLAGVPGYSSLVFAGNSQFGHSDGFNAGSTFKLFTLIDWLEKGHSVRETLNGRVRKITKMKNSCAADGSGWWIDQGAKPIQNFGGGNGTVGNPLSFTASSLNSGYLAMAEKLDLCDIRNVATKMGVTLAKGGEPVKMDGAFSVIGPNAVSPMAMAGAYATVANKGIYCQPQAIDRVTDSDGNELPRPERTCSQVISPEVAATAAFALQGVMTGGTGRGGNPFDGTPLLGKTGTHEEIQTWMIESSTKVATAAWVGNYDGFISVFDYRQNDKRYALAREVQAAANQFYPGERFPAPDSNLSRTVLTDLPNVVGMTVQDAEAQLRNAGFDVIVGGPVDSDQAEGLVAAQNPGAGKVAGGATVTINPSNGQAITVPEVSGQPLNGAIGALRSAGFGNVTEGTCTPDEAAAQPRATGTSPGAGSVVNRNSAITVDYAAANCGGGRGNDDNDD
ncbi:transglycosylase domain-containing protein [Microbacterium sp. HD4P20]|uniref:transglycosylase domain-containing protein n=1 Tax=Microbacterium sp. HD4P20 TaxID=2864874 RepID=UPI001C6441CE|nr:transglycosylase domain-containing protein [Microbacterium sp. HD4P20]MCP2637533.1 transglycosylase domain-containing protein [Microbacterium sp. HD4P20]